MAQFIQFLTKKKQLLAFVIFASGLIFYSIQSFKYANTIPSTVWDEGMYMYNGYLFTTGEYIPYEEGSPWTNQLPFAYLMSGIPQVLFGPGMRTGRYFAVLMGVLSLLGLSLAAKRLGGDWWAAAVAWIVALNSGWVMAFSQVFSQGMVSFMISWALFFLVGKKQPSRELIASAFLFGLAGMVRVNVLPLVFLMILYTFWQKRAKDAALVFNCWIDSDNILPRFVLAKHLEILGILDTTESVPNDYGLHFTMARDVLAEWFFLASDIYLVGGSNTSGLARFRDFRGFVSLKCDLLAWDNRCDYLLPMEKRRRVQSGNEAPGFSNWHLPYDVRDT